MINSIIRVSKAKNEEKFLALYFHVILEFCEGWECIVMFRFWTRQHLQRPASRTAHLNQGDSCLGWPSTSCWMFQRASLVHLLAGFSEKVSDPVPVWLWKVPQSRGKTELMGQKSQCLWLSLNPFLSTVPVSGDLQTSLNPLEVYSTLLWQFSELNCLLLLLIAVINFQREEDL